MTLKNIIMYINLILVHIEEKTKLLYYVTIADQLDSALTCKNYILEERKRKNNIIDNNHSVNKMD